MHLPVLKNRQAPSTVAEVGISNMATESEQLQKAYNSVRALIWFWENKRWSQHEKVFFSFFNGQMLGCTRGRGRISVHLHFNLCSRTNKTEGYWCWLKKENIQGSRLDYALLPREGEKIPQKQTICDWHPAHFNLKRKSF